MIDNVISYLKKFFEISDPKSYVEFRVFGKKGIIKNFFVQVEDIHNEDIFSKKDIESFLKGYNFYFGILPRVGKKGTSNAVKSGSTLWIDFDCHDLQGIDKNEVRKKYEEFIKKLKESFFPTPNFVLFSGKGFQCYWFLDKNIEAEKLEKLEEALLDRLHEFFPQNIDKQVKDLARIMRVPLSQNIKYEFPIDTEVWFYNGIRFPAKFMEDFLLKFKPEEKKPEEVEKLIETGKLERKLKKYQRDRIVEVISNFWLPGFRNAMEMSLVGLLIKNGISYPHAEDIVKRICLKTHDEEVKQRLKNLEYHYKHRVELGEKLKGSKGIADIIWEILNSEIPEELLKDKPELQKLISLKNKGGLIRDDIDDYVSNLLRSLGLTRNIFKDEGIKTYSLTELLQMSREDVDYIVDKLIPKKSLVIIGGRPESFKSIFSLLLGVSCALGEKFLKFQTKKSRVLYVDAENGENIISQRLAYFYGDNIKTEDFQYYYFEDFNLLKTLITREKFDLVIFDSFRRFLKGSEVESDVINKFYQGFLKPLRDAGATIILIHHFRKKKGDLTDEELLELFRGSSDIIAMVDMAYALEKAEEVSDVDEGITRYIINFRKVKNRLGIPINDFGFLIEKNDKLKRSKIEFAEFKVYLTLEDRMKEAVVDILSSGNEMTRSEIKAQLIKRGFEVNDRVLTNVLKSLVLVGRIVKLKRGVYRIYAKDLLNKFFGDVNGNGNDAVEEY